ncbi:MAG: cyclic nucleotide-binding domain-containing protein [Pseudolabrys sp.]
MGGWGVSWSDVPGHVSYVLIALSYWMTNVFWLRVIAVIGLVFEILYFRMSSGDMHTGVGWDIIFIAINLYQIFRLVLDKRRLRYMKELHLLSQGAFASLTREQLAQLVKVGSWRTFEPGTEVTREGEPVKDLILICDGQMVVESQGQTITHLHGGSLVGELAFVSGRPATATVTAQRITRAFVLEMEKLRKLVRVDDLVASAIDRVVGRDLAAKLTASTEYNLSGS